MKAKHTTKSLIGLIGIASSLLLMPVCLAQKIDRSGPELGDEQRPPQWRSKGEAGMPRGEGPMGHFRQWSEKMQQENPEEFERLMKLREDDPERFREEVGAMVKQQIGKRLQNMPPEEKACIELSQKYHQATTDQEKAALKTELEEAVGKAFDARLEEQKQDIEAMEKRLDQLKQRIAERQAKKVEICRQRLQQLTSDPRLRW